ncbi:MAG TPA: VWA domain-containing protein, partial [Vicinamibacterales bacterium]|nr:VWA domain-containing protein [Vicinamibacterales bacterium]
MDLVVISVAQPFRRRACSAARVCAVRVLLCGLLGLWTAAPRAQGQPQRGQVFRSGTELVLVNVVVRDKSGAVVRGLRRDDFSVTEDDKPQTITSFDVEELDVPRPAEASATAPQALLSPAARPALTPQATFSAEPVKIDMHGRRLIVLFFDLSSMQPEEIDRSVKAAHDYIDQRLSPVDLIAVVSFSTSLHVDQDFTADREALGAAVDAYGGASGQGFEAGLTPDDDT